MLERVRNEVTIAKALSENKKSFRKFEFFTFAVRTNVKQKERQKTKQKNQEHRKIAPLSIQLRNYNNNTYISNNFFGTRTIEK